MQPLGGAENNSGVAGTRLPHHGLARSGRHPEVEIVAELVGGTTVAAEIVKAAIANRKSVVTANKELMAACGPEIWERAIHAGINVAMEASVAAAFPSMRCCAKVFRATASRPSTAF